MTGTFNRQERLLVDSNVIVLPQGVTLPGGEYAVTTTYYISPLPGQRREQLRMVKLYLSREFQENVGVSFGDSAQIGVGIDVSEYVHNGRARLLR